MNSHPVAAEVLTCIQLTSTINLSPSLLVPLHGCVYHVLRASIMPADQKIHGVV